MRKEKYKTAASGVLMCALIALLLTGCGIGPRIEPSADNASVSATAPTGGDKETGADSTELSEEIDLTAGYGYLGGNDDMNEGGGAQLATENGAVYFVNKLDHGFLYRMNLDGSDQNCILQEKTGELNVLGGWIYYQPAGKLGIFRMKTDGSQITKIYGNSVHFMTVVDDTIYFSEAVETNKIYLSKIDINGHGYQRLYDFTEYGVYPEVQISGDDGYVAIDQREAGKVRHSQMYKVALDGSGMRMIFSSNNVLTKFVAAPEGIYTFGEDDKVYRIDRDGDNDTIVQNGKVAELIVDEYCEKFIVVGGHVVFLAEPEGYIGYATPDGEISATRISVETDYGKDDFFYDGLYYADGYVYYYKRYYSDDKPGELLVVKLL